MDKLFTELKWQDAAVSKGETCQQIQGDRGKPPAACQARQESQTDDRNAKFDENERNIHHPPLDFI
jgi:hypothetical protein